MEGCHNPVIASQELLFSQHGWADTNRKMLAFGRAVAGPRTQVVAPPLGYARTWLRLEPLIDRVEAEVAPLLDRRPARPAVVAGHSLGGLIWLTILDRRPEWRARVRALALLGSPVGGADLSTHFRRLDPAGLTIAHDLSVDRREVAERVATAVPTLAVAGDLVHQTDGTITVDSARFDGARFVCLPNESHARMLHSRWVIRLVRAYLLDPRPAPADAEAIIRRLRAIASSGSDPAGAGAPDAGPPPPAPEGSKNGGRRWPLGAGRGAGERLYVGLLFRDGTTVRVGRRVFGPVGVSVNGPGGPPLWAGTVGRRRAGDLWSALQEIAREQPAAIA